MTAMITCIAGLLIGFLLFYRKPYLENADLRNVNFESPDPGGSDPEGAKIKRTGLNRVSVIIPARNEEKNLPHLLLDLQRQVCPAYEIICVDDSSEDRTAELIRQSGAQLVSITEKPEGWVGKTWACKCGAARATGDLLLFLDADVRLHPAALTKLINTYQKEGCVISVQPFHTAKKIYEQFSFFFSLILVAGNGVGFPFGRRYIGLFGPVILIPANTYYDVKGHNTVQRSVVDDLALGEALKRQKIPFSLFMGGPDISFRMYGGGFRDLCQGWIKNFAAGAARTPIVLLFMIILWFGGCTAVFYELIRAVFDGKWESIAVYAGLYAAWVIALWLISRRVGRFSVGAVILYPFLLVFFYIIFLVSTFMKVFHLSVIWKGRKIKI